MQPMPITGRYDDGEQQRSATSDRIAAAAFAFVAIVILLLVITNCGPDSVPTPCVIPTAPSSYATLTELNLLQLTHGDDFNGGSGADDFVIAQYAHLSPDRNKVMIDVGANKGMYTFELLMNWCPIRQQIHALLSPESAGTLGGLGACSLVVHTFEPVPSNHRILTNFLHGKLKQDNVVAHNAGVSDADGQLVFYTTRGLIGDEQASLNPALANDRSFEALPPVKVVTIDSFLKQHGLLKVHLMKLDGEGYDPQMLFGSTQSLAARQIDIVQFEYNGKWRDIPNVDTTKHSLGNIVKHLEQLGYDTFLVGKKNLYQLSRGMWNAKYEFWGWSNAFAFSRSMDATLRERILRGVNTDFPVLKPLSS